MATPKGQEAGTKLSLAITVPKCERCSASVYDMERLDYDRKVFHKSCFKCLECKRNLELRTVNAIMVAWHFRFYSRIVNCLTCIINFNSTFTCFPRRVAKFY